ncbi:MAG TPA: ATP-binding protein [Thermoanaerobaculia bacterium]|nr:ATP-binding protein [Thermoanaerobaculia bacterium]
MKKRRPSHDAQILRLALAGGLPALVACAVLLRVAGAGVRVSVPLLALLAALWIGFAFAARERVVRSLQTIANLIGGLRENDYSVRGREAGADDAMGDVVWEINQLTGILQEQRFGAIESAALLKAVMTKIEIAIFAFDDEERVRLANRAGERLLGAPIDRLLGRTAGELGVADWLTGPTAKTIQGPVAGRTGRWAVRRSVFRERGRPQQLVVVADLQQALREEERQAWQRIIRVLGHELNNSLAPIQSIAESLQGIVAHGERPEDWEADLRRGLQVIGARAAALSRFMDGYRQLARLPAPQPGRIAVEDLVRRVAGLETRIRVDVRPGPPVVLEADADQIEQLLINLTRNAADAAIETKAGVVLSWRGDAAEVEIIVTDGGPGLANTANLFVPFFTTKPGGSGIGLSLSRQIAEAHGGTLSLENRPDGRGCIARLVLPLASAAGE